MKFYSLIPLVFLLSCASQRSNHTPPKKAQEAAPKKRIAVKKYDTPQVSVEVKDNKGKVYISDFGKDVMYHEFDSGNVNPRNLFANFTYQTEKYVYSIIKINKNNTKYLKLLRDGVDFKPKPSKLLLYKDQVDLISDGKVGNWDVTLLCAMMTSSASLRQKTKDKYQNSLF